MDYKNSFNNNNHALRKYMRTVPLHTYSRQRVLFLAHNQTSGQMELVAR
jgi:hypothetical protein